MFYETQEFIEVCKRIGQRRNATTEQRRVHTDSIKDLQDIVFCSRQCAGKGHKGRVLSSHR